MTRPPEPDRPKAGQLPLFSSSEGAKAPTAGVFGRRLLVNPHLLAARRLSRQIRRLPVRSEAETDAGLAICRALKAYLADPH